VDVFCGAVRYAASSNACARDLLHWQILSTANRSAYLVGPIFQKTHFAIISGKPATYAQASEGSRKAGPVNFCATCGTKLFLDLERFPETLASMAGTFDDPNWFERNPQVSETHFLDSALMARSFLPVSARFRDTRGQREHRSNR